MPNGLREVPEQIWWCFKCNGGVGSWGGNGNPPPRCPECHSNDFATVKFIPEVKEPGAKGA